MGQIFGILDTVQSDKEDENDELMNDSDTEFITLEEIELTQTPRVFWLQKKISMLLTKGRHTLHN